MWDGQRQSVVNVHRVVYALTIGVDHSELDGMVCHTCDNPPCCNPAHLYLGTAQTNVQDMIDRGRADLSGLALGPEARRKR